MNPKSYGYRELQLLREELSTSWLHQYARSINTWPNPHLPGNWELPKNPLPDNPTAAQLRARGDVDELYGMELISDRAYERACTFVLWCLGPSHLKLGFMNVRNNNRGVVFSAHQGINYVEVTLPDQELYEVLVQVDLCSVVRMPVVEREYEWATGINLATAVEMGINRGRDMNVVPLPKWAVPIVEG